MGLPTQSLSSYLFCVWVAVVSFIVGVIAIRFFIGLITHYGLRFFGYYRIILGVAILTLMALGYHLQMQD